MKKICILSAFVLFLCLFSINVYAGEQQYNALNFDVTLNLDGSATIVETLDVYISSTNTMFKQFKLEPKDNYFIKEPKVTQVVSGQEIPLTQIYEYQSHVDSDCYYGLMLDTNTYELAWNVDLDNSSDVRTYKLYYTVENAVKVYSDCSEFYWQFVSADNPNTMSNVTGTITLPSGITNVEKLHIWGHGDFNGNTARNSTNYVTFDMDRLYANSMLEIRVVAEDNIFEAAQNTKNEAKLASILEEEARWAEEANAKKERYKKVINAVIVVEILIFLIILAKIIKYIGAGQELKLKQYPKNELKYFRDIPDEKNSSPARASYMYYFSKIGSNFENFTANIFSATILQLTLKKYISLEPINKKNVKINILDKNSDIPLTEDEEIVYKFIGATCDSNTKSVETATLEKYAKKHYEQFHSIMNNICNSAKKYEEDKNIDKERKALAMKWSAKGIFYYIALIFIPFITMGFQILPLVFASIPIVFELIFCGTLCIINSNKVVALTPEGYEEVNRWKGLKKYMEDFSLLKEKEVPDLILWEKYLVYATTFGISKKVIEQLIKVYPQMTSDEYYRNHNCTYLYIASNSEFDGLSNLDKSFSDICRTANSAYSAAHSSSSGSGGGFSGGGGGRRRWRKLRW